jgi:GNAT superfamily N-acetyltransferase
LGIRFRDFQPDDIPALVEIINRTFPDEPTTVAQEEHWEKTITSMTGVSPLRRGKGLALAFKLLSFHFLKEHGYVEARAHNDTANPPILRLNEKLGYQRLPGWLVWKKSLTTAAPE